MFASSHDRWKPALISSKNLPDPLYSIGSATARDEGRTVANSAAINALRRIRVIGHCTLARLVPRRTCGFVGNAPVETPKRLTVVCLLSRDLAVYQSSRRATRGSTAAARRAGIQQAMKPPQMTNV